MISNRRYDIDALRVLAFGILILYHCGMLFVPGWGWHIKSSYQIDALPGVMQFFNAWRMPLLFLVSGAAIALANPQKRLADFVSSRTFRLLFPLLMAMIFTVPLQAYVQAVANGSIEPGLLLFLIHYFSFSPWPEGAFDGSDVGFTWNHLWYLPYLFIYTLLLVGLLKLKTMLGLTVKSLSTGTVLVVTINFIITLVALKLLVRPHFPETHALYNDWYAHPYYFGFFIFGYMLGRPACAHIWHKMADSRWTLLALSLSSFAIWLGLKQCNDLQVNLWLFAPAAGELQLNGASYLLCGTTIKTLLHTLYSVSMIATILAFGFKYLNKPDSAVARYSQAIFPWYIMHQTLIVLLAYWLVPLRIGVVAEAVLVISGTFIGCYMIYRYVIMPLPFLHSAFGIFSKK